MRLARSAAAVAVGVVAALSSGTALAGSLLSEWGLVVAQDIGASNARINYSLRVHGSALVGGSVYSQGFALWQNQASTTQTIGKIGGNLDVTGKFDAPSGTTFVKGFVSSGESPNLPDPAVLKAGGSITLKTNPQNLNFGNYSGRLVQNSASIPPIPGSQAIHDELRVLSDAYALLTPNATTSLNGSNLTLNLSGGGPAVFKLDAAELLGKNILVSGTASSIIVNVTGTAFNWTGNNNLRLPNLLWNFFEATSLSFGSGWGGTVLAPGATVTGASSDFHGGLGVKAITGFNAQHHPTLFDFVPPPPPSVVPVPGAASAGLLLLAGLTLRRRRRVA